MARSNKPLIWLPFAAGGTIAAFLLPAVAVAILLASTGVLDSGDGLAHEQIIAIVGHPLGILAVAVVLVLPLWHAAHRLRMTLQDLGVRGRRTRMLVARICYSVAAVATVIVVFLLGRMPWI